MEKEQNVLFFLKEVNWLSLFVAQPINDCEMEINLICLQQTHKRCNGSYFNGIHIVNKNVMEITSTFFFTCLMCITDSIRWRA